MGEAHPSFPSSPGWRDSCGPPEEEEEEETSICFNFSSTSKHAEGVQRPQEREVPLLFRGLSSRGKLVSESRMVFTGAAIVPPICRDTERPPCTDKSTAAGSEFNTFPATVITVIGNWDRCGISFHCEENREKIICNLCKKFLQLLNKYCVV